MKKMENKPYKKMIGTGSAVLAVAAVAVLGFLFTDTQTKWYHALAKPAFQPPDMAFPIVWTLVYVLIAVSLVRLLTLDGTVKKSIWILYGAGGLLNVLWTFAFFQMQQPVLAFAILLALVIETVILLRAVAQKDALCGWCLVPYLIWLVFANILNYVIIMIN
ncbi:MAG: TspO/MBR family protein [Bacillota bacterium]